MAAPAVTALVSPTGIKLKDGYSSRMAFAADPNVNIWIKSLKPPGVDGGDAIDNTTMHNDDWRIMRARSLKTLTESTGKGGYDPVVYNELVALVNVEGAITEHFPDGSTLSYYGYLKNAEFDELVEGTMPELAFTVVPTNYDPVNDVEAGPLMVEVAGT